jgi:hypothetical protein
MTPRELQELERMTLTEQTRLGSAGSSSAGYEGTAKGYCAREQTSRELLLALCQTKELELRSLEQLLKALPLELPYEADCALRRLLQK